MIPIVFSTDHNFIMPTGIAIQSLFESATESNYDIFIITADNVTEVDRNSLRALTAGTEHKITFLQAGSELNNAYEVRDISVATYFRFFIPELVPQYDKVIYLDGDIIVNTDLRELYHTPMEGKLIGGVRTYGVATSEKLRKHSVRIGADPDQYVNAGVLLINNALWRQENLRPILMGEAKKKYEFQDQDILNKVCRGRIALLSPRYNYNYVRDVHAYAASGTASLHEIEEAAENPSIIHYAGEKPWKGFSMYWRKWWEVYERSPFFDPELERRVSKNHFETDLSFREIAKMIARKFIYGHSYR